MARRPLTRNNPDSFDKELEIYKVEQDLLEGGISFKFGETAGPLETTFQSSLAMRGGGMPTADDLLAQEMGTQVLTKVMHFQASLTAQFTRGRTYGSLAELQSRHPDAKRMLIDPPTGKQTLGWTVVNVFSNASVFAKISYTCKCNKECKPLESSPNSFYDLVQQNLKNMRPNGEDGLFSSFRELKRECCAPCRGWYINEFGYMSSLFTTIGGSTYHGQNSGNQTMFVDGTYDTDMDFAADKDKMLAEMARQVLRLNLGQPAISMAGELEVKNCTGVCEEIV